MEAVMPRTGEPDLLRYRPSLTSRRRVGRSWFQGFAPEAVGQDERARLANGVESRLPFPHDRQRHVSGSPRDSQDLPRKGVRHVGTGTADAWRFHCTVFLTRCLRPKEQGAIALQVLLLRE